MVFYPTDYYRNATKIVYDSANICMNASKVIFTHFYPLAFCMKYQVDVDFYKSTCHILNYLFCHPFGVLLSVLISTGVAPLPMFCRPFRALVVVPLPGFYSPFQGEVYSLHLFSWGK